MTFRIFETSSSTEIKWFEERTVPVTAGAFAVDLGDVKAIPTDVLALPSLYLEVQVSGQTLSGRQRLMTVPYSHRSGWSSRSALADNATVATKATSADSANSATSATHGVSGATFTADSLLVNGTTTVNGVLTTNGAISAGSSIAVAGNLSVAAAFSLSQPFCVLQKRGASCPAGFTSYQPILYYSPTSYWCNTYSPNAGVQPYLVCSNDGVNNYAALAVCCN
jgi:hypothetical protein